MGAKLCSFDFFILGIKNKVIKQSIKSKLCDISRSTVYSLVEPANIIFYYRDVTSVLGTNTYFIVEI